MTNGTSAEVDTTKLVNGLRWTRRHTKAGTDPFTQVEWEERNLAINDETGKPVFEQKGCEFPITWSLMASQVVANKYFAGGLNTDRREHSLRQVILRVVNTVCGWAEKDAYFASPEDLAAFRDELIYLLLHQKMSFNSPVWFNLGVSTSKPQCSACFIQHVNDDIGSIYDLAKSEGLLFKYGSGTGTNLSTLRSSKERLTGGGTSSGPVSFMKGFDSFAGVVKSGGTTRRAAKMVILNMDHGDIEEFILCKAKEERKAHALIDAGYDGSFTGEAYGSIFFQNSNNSVRVTDEFMRAVENGEDWNLWSVTQPRRILDTVPARKLFHLMAQAAWECGDPGIQYDTTINDWHTVPNTDRIYGSNPCAEFLFLDDSSCNLASLNLLRFLREDGTIDVEDYRYAIDLTITAQEVMVSNASYPTQRIEENSHKFRPLGLGFANLGALLMARGVPYDSDAGREIASVLTSILAGEAYAQVARIAEFKGPFEGFALNREPMLRVIRKHRDAAQAIVGKTVGDDAVVAAKEVWDEALALGEEFGYRNAQVTVAAPTGTISFMLDCDTTGIEPDIALVKYKKMVGGGMLKMVNQTIPRALRQLGYSRRECDEIVAYIEREDTIEGAPHLREKDVEVFDCAFRPLKGKRSISWMGHLKMLAAIQPYLSGSASKTVNLPHDVTTEDIETAYMQGWKMGLKCVAVYRDGCKRSQPLSTKMEGAEGAKPEPTSGLWNGEERRFIRVPVRKRLPVDRNAKTHKFEIAGHEGYITVGLYDDGTPGEIFLRVAKEGSTISGLMENFAVAVSMAIQYGVPIEALIDKFAHSRFEPQGFTRNPQIPIAKSMMDYIFRWLASQFCSLEVQDRLGIQRLVEDEHGQTEHGPYAALASEAASALKASNSDVIAQSLFTFENQSDAPICSCGGLCFRNGACYICSACGTSSGCS